MAASGAAVVVLMADFHAAIVNTTTKDGWGRRNSNNIVRD